MKFWPKLWKSDKIMKIWETFWKSDWSSEIRVRFWKSWQHSESLGNFLIIWLRRIQTFHFVEKIWHCQFSPKLVMVYFNLKTKCLVTFKNLFMGLNVLVHFWVSETKKFAKKWPKKTLKKVRPEFSWLNSPLEISIFHWKHVVFMLVSML